MEHHADVDAALVVSVALAAGMVAQSLARHLRLPGIVVLLAAGLLLGPDVAGVVRPESLGSGLHLLVGFAVAVILFEGGMNLSLARLRGQAKVIRRLITVGAVVTAAGGALCARLIMGWDWRLAVSFGTLVVVTGPTVVTPLLRRIKVKHKVATVLEAEGVLIDAIGAVLAVVTLQVVISPYAGALTQGALSVLARLAFGAGVGAVGGLVIALLLRYRKVVPDGFENVFTLALVLVLFQTSNSVMAESGIMAVTAAGLVVGNMRTRVRRELMEFKEQLTVMLIGMLFVLLAADVRLERVLGLGRPAVLTVAALMLIVRPLNVVVSTLGSDLKPRERLFLSWVAPRGVVAAAVASLFAQTLTANGIGAGEELRALVFTVIAATVLVQGLSGGLVARVLGLRRPVHEGYAILGANALGQTMGRLLRRHGEEVVFIDNNPTGCKAVEEDGFKVVYGNVIEERTLRRARLEDRAACVAVTANEEINLLLGRNAAADFDVERIYVATRRDSASVTPELIERSGGRVLFGRPRDLELWTVRLRRGIVRVESWRRGETFPDAADDSREDPLDFPEGLILPLVVGERGSAVPWDGAWKRGKKDVVWLALFGERVDEAKAWLVEHGWEPAPDALPVQEDGRP